MKIKQLEFLGFKSFADRTVIDFDDYISAVVGPNGCGKSNLLDGLRWVMGEMSAKSLRGTAMSDVIFSGTDERKPLGMAEVSLVLDNSDGSAPPGYEGCAEIMITRRLYRSGESEYLINKVVCRLRDINELFMDTGLGVRAYAMIEQGQIDRIISSKPEQRRTLIEEAAGITKYKARKEEALRKVDSTQQNLLRVNDLITEIGRAVNSLARQAGKARRYREYKTELRQIDLAVSAREFAGLQWDSELGQSRMRALERGAESESGKLEAAEVRLQDERLRLLELEKRLNGWQSDLYALQAEIQAAETEGEHLGRESGKLEGTVQSARAEIADYSRRQDESEQERQRLIAERNELLSSIDGAQSDLLALEQRVLQARQAVELEAAELERRKGRLVDLLTEGAALKGSHEAAHGRIEEYERRRASLEQREAEQTEQRADASQRFEEIERDLRLIDGQLVDFEARCVDLRRRRATLSDEGGNLGARYEALKSDIEGQRVRLRSLKAMQANLEGYQRGVKTILRRHSESPDGENDVRGVVADFIETDVRYETALEALLGDRLQGVVVDSQASGMGAVEYLKTSAAGRSTFIPMDLREAEPNSFGQHALSMAECPLRQVISVRPGYEQVADYLLGDALLVKDIDTAHRVWKANGYRGVLVTMDGELLDDSGVVTGGQPESVQSGILQTKREIKELEQRIAGLLGSYNEAESAHLMNKGLIEQVARKLEQTEQELRRLQIDRINTANAAGNVRAELEALEQEAQRLTVERSELGRGLEHDRRFVDEAQARLAGIERERAELGGLVREIDQRLHAARGEQDNSLAELSERRIEVGALRERANQLAAALTRLEGSRADLAGVVRRRTVEIDAALARQAEIVVARRALAARLQELHGRRAEHEGGLREVQQEYGAGQTALQQREAEIKSGYRLVERLRDELRSLQVADAEVRLKLEHALSQIRERYGLELAECAAEHLEFESDPLAQSALQRELRRKIEEMGEVNPNAVEEYAEQKQRLEFFTAQRDDLIKAMETLKRTITRINQTSRKLFAETFDKVNQQFQQVIPILFNGGSARLALTESDDVLEAGLDIEVRPPGKRLTNVTLLSGGEKALSAIGLIFSLFLIKPSPFCVLDEVDAPLDDSNIDRFNTLLRQMNEHSQLVLITHNKRTMEIANRLYGVTMEEKGVSKIVSVKLN